MSNNNNKGGIYGKGYYIALILCATAIGISGYMYYRNANNAENQVQAAVSENVAVQQQEENEPVIVIQPAEEEAVDAVATVPAAVQPDTALKTAMPLQGQTVAAYAMDCLSYNATTRDWRVHNGVDIAAEAGTEVCAAADGTVYTTFEDDSMGMTVVIRHTGGYTTCYSSLAPELKVSAGDSVKLGQAIGCVGSTALTESAMGDHVHVSVTYRDEAMDPADFLSVG